MRYIKWATNTVLLGLLVTMSLTVSSQSEIQDSCACPPPSKCYTKQQRIKAIESIMIVEDVMPKLDSNYQAAKKIIRNQDEIISNHKHFISQQKKQLRKARFNKVLGRAKSFIILTTVTVGEFFVLKWLFTEI